MLGLDNGDGGKGRGEFPVYFSTSLNETEPATFAEPKQSQKVVKNDGGGGGECPCVHHSKNLEGQMNLQHN